MTGGFDWVRQRSDDVLRGEVEFRDISKVLSDGLSGDRQLGAIDEVGVVEEVFHHSWDASNFVKVLHYVLSGRPGLRMFNGPLSIPNSDVLQVYQERCLVSDSLEIVDRQLDFSRPGHRKKVQNLCAHQYPT